MLKNVNTYRQPEYVRWPLLAKYLLSSLQVHKHHIQDTVYRETHIAKQRKSFFLCEASSEAKERSSQRTQTKNSVLLKKQCVAKPTRLIFTTKFLVDSP